MTAAPLPVASREHARRRADLGRLGLPEAAGRGSFRPVSPRHPRPSHFRIVELDRSTAALSGELDMHTARELGRWYDELTAPLGDVITLDMAGVTFLDSSGLRAVIEIRRRLAVHGCRLVLRDPSVPVVRVIQVTGLQELLD